MFFAIFVIGVLGTAALYTWFNFNYFGGVYKVLEAFREQTGIVHFSAIALFALIAGFWTIMSLLAWPLMLIFIAIALGKRFNETGSFKIKVPNKVPNEN